MVATDSILISATIDAHKGRDVATINIPGAFLNAYNNKETIMLMKGCLAKLMVQVDPQLYCKYIICQEVADGTQHSDKILNN